MIHIGLSPRARMHHLDANEHARHRAVPFALDWTNWFDLLSVRRSSTPTRGALRRRQIRLLDPYSTPFDGVGRWALSLRCVGRSAPSCARAVDETFDETLLEKNRRNTKMGILCCALCAG